MQKTRKTNNRYRLFRQLLFGLTITAICAAAETMVGADSIPYAERREKMVINQIESRGITDPRVLSAMRTVERHRFVPEAHREKAYFDHPLPIANDQTISQPYIVALMTELLKLDSGTTVLEVGTGSGYQAAVLAELVEAVYTIEIVPELAASAGQLLDELGYENVTVRSGDGYAGWPEKAPFGAILVTCAPPTIPGPLIDQLAVGGRLVIPVGTDWQELVVIEKKKNGISRRDVIPVRFVPMTGKARKGE
ncbi:MAG: protein-L-isoaspartate(D-aspartate) O-methyltransferase [Candidatus Zixiibacteriota bacterium]